MKRSLDTLTNQQFDVLIIGAGIHGAATAWECSRHGLKTALIEKNDFCGATSANSLKIIHGGLRYLQHLNIKRMRESILSRRIMSELSPHNIQVIGCLIPNSGYGLQSNLTMRIGLKLNDCIAFDRNRGIEKDCRIPSSKILPLSRCREILPSIKWSGMSGASLWYEAMAFNSERLTLSFIKEAAQNGAAIANYTELQEFLVDENGRIAGCHAVDGLENAAFTIKARTVVVSGGASNNKLLENFAISGNITNHWAKAVNIIVRRPLFPDYAIGLTGEVAYQDRDAVLKKKGRFFFFVPWRGYTMIGTSYKRYEDSVDKLQANRNDIEELLTEVNAIYPAAQLTLADVTNVHVGLVPLSSLHDDPNGDVQLEKETTVTAYGDGTKAPRGLLSVESVKFTTAPVVAQETTEKVIRLLRENMKEEYQAKRLQPHGHHVPASNIPPQFAYLQKRYGQEAGDVLTYVLKNEKQVSSQPPLCLGEIDYFIEEEMARTVSDVVFRRSELATAECPSEDVLQKISTYMGQILGWSEQLIQEQVKEVKEHFHWN
jgi:glycerol-3-phosphate dehydrogenase